MLPRFSTEYARECDELTGQAGSVPSKHYRNQVVVRAFGSPPSDFTLNKLYTYSLDDENDYNFKWRFRDLVLRPTDDYNLLEFCKAANVPVSFYGLDEAAIVRPQRPGLPMFQEHKREWDVRDCFAYKHCIDLSIQQEDAKTANAEVKKFSSLAKRLQWDNDYEDYYEFGSGGAWACGRTTGHQRTPTNRDSKANSTKQLQPKPQSSPLTTPKKSPTGKGKARSYTITLDDTDEEDGSSTDEDFFDFKDTNVYKRIKHTSSNNMPSFKSPPHTHPSWFVCCVGVDRCHPRNSRGMRPLRYPPSSQPQPQPGQAVSLARLAFATSGLRLDKTEQCSDWQLRPLRRAQLLYAALDAWCLIGIHDQMTAARDERSGLTY